MATHASNKPHVVNFEGHRWVETGVKCPGCNQQISCDITDQRGALECGEPSDRGMVHHHPRQCCRWLAGLSADQAVLDKKTPRCC